MNLTKPIRQAHKEKRGLLKTANSQRNGSRTSKNAQRQHSKETFDEFVARVQKENDNSIDNQYAVKTRPYTSSGYGNQFRIKNKRPGSRSGIKLYDETKNYPYNPNRAYAQQFRRKAQPKGIEYKSSKLLNESASKRANHRCTFYPNTGNSLVDRTTFSNETTESTKINKLHKTYLPKTSKLSNLKL